MFYPQNENDNKLLENFKDIVEKYKYKINQGVYIKKANALYPRLSSSQKRGKRSAEEVIKDLCDGLIPNIHFCIIYDIMSDIEIKYDTEYNIFYSNRLVSFINLINKIPIFNTKSKILKIKKEIKNANFNGEQLNELCKFITGLHIWG